MVTLPVFFVLQNVANNICHFIRNVRNSIFIYEYLHEIEAIFENTLTRQSVAQISQVIGG